MYKIFWNNLCIFSSLFFLNNDINLSVYFSAMLSYVCEVTIPSKKFLLPDLRWPHSMHGWTLPPEIITNAWPIPNGNDRTMHGFECMVAPLWVMKWCLFIGLTCNLCVTAVCRFVSRDVSSDPTSRSETTNWM